VKIGSTPSGKKKKSEAFVYRQNQRKKIIVKFSGTLFGGPLAAGGKQQDGVWPWSGKKKTKEIKNGKKTYRKRVCTLGARKNIRLNGKKEGVSGGPPFLSEGQRILSLGCIEICLVGLGSQENKDRG